MPNWCNCSFTVKGASADIARFVEIGLKNEDIAKADESDKDTNDNREWRMSNYYPPPTNDKAYKMQSLFYWQETNWGTKWDCIAGSKSFQITETSFDVQFESAWSPPIAWLRKVQKDFPTLLFRLDYIEEGMWFAGVAYTDQKTRTIIDEEGEPCFREIMNEQNIYSAGDGPHCELINQDDKIRTIDSLYEDNNFQVVSPFDTFRTPWEKDAKS